MRIMDHERPESYWREVARQAGVKDSTYRMRRKRGMAPHLAVKPPEDLSAAGITARLKAAGIPRRCYYNVREELEDEGIEATTQDIIEICQARKRGAIAAAARDKPEATEARNGRKPDSASYRALGREYGINYGTLRNRLQRGMTLDEAVSEPVLTRKQCGKAAAKKSWEEGMRHRKRGPASLLTASEECGISLGTLSSRVYDRGMTLKQAVSMPIMTREQCGKASAKARWGKGEES